MTMRVSSNLPIAGVSSIQVRDVLRYLGENGSVESSQYFRDKLKISANKAGKLFTVLVTEGFLEKRDRETKWYYLSAKGRTLARATGLHPMNREKAEAILAGLLTRVEEVNRTPHYMFTVESIFVFGSFLRDTDKLGDLDVAIGLRSKYSGEEWEQALHSRMQQDHVNGSTIAIRIRLEVLRHLRNREPRVSVYEVDDVAEMMRSNPEMFRQVFGA